MTSDAALIEAYVLHTCATDTHGYEIMAALRNADIIAESALMYRRLRRMDNAGLLRSVWTSSPAGPNRRVYSTTAKGYARLKDLRAVIAAERDRRDKFLALPDPQEDAAAASQ